MDLFSAVCRLLRCGGFLAVFALAGVIPIFGQTTGETSGVTATAPSLAELNAAYRLRVSDLVAVSIFGEPELDVLQRVDADGCLRLPLIGPVKVAGETVQDAARRMESAFVEQELLRRPEVSIVVREYAGRGVSVLGQVLSPGRVEFPLEVNAMALTEVISRAGGFTGIARANAVRLTRVVEGQETTRVIDANRLIRGDSAGGSTSAENVVVLPGDIIFVPESFF